MDALHARRITRDPRAQPEVARAQPIAEQIGELKLTGLDPIDSGQEHQMSEAFLIAQMQQHRP